MAIRTLKLAQNFCFAREIRLEDESRLKRAIDAHDPDSAETVALYQRLIDERRGRVQHEAACPVCCNDQRWRSHVLTASSHPVLPTLAGGAA